MRFLQKWSLHSEIRILGLKKCYQCKLEAPGSRSAELRWTITANLEAHTSPKIHHFLWRCVSDALPTAATMRKRHISKDGSCGRCAMDKETANHILFKCPYARLVWAISPICAPPNGEWPDSLCANLYRVMNHKQHPHPEFAKDDLVPWLLWRIWKNRNDYLFKGVDYSAPNTIDKALEDME